MIESNYDKERCLRSVNKKVERKVQLENAFGVRIGQK